VACSRASASIRGLSPVDDDNYVSRMVLAQAAGLVSWSLLRFTILNDANLADAAALVSESFLDLPISDLDALIHEFSQNEQSARVLIDALRPLAHTERFRKVSPRYPRRVAEAYGGNLERALADSDEEVAATVAAWEQAHGLDPRDWSAVGAAERDPELGW
jgi:hypothetical protein